MTGQWVAGVYCGDRQTVALLSNVDGCILARGISLLVSNSSSGPEGRLPAIEQALENAFSSAGYPSVLPELGWIGISDLGRRDGHELEDIFHTGRLRQAKLHISSEAELVLAAGIPQGFGVAVSAGGTSLVVGKNPDGMRAKAGGWGLQLGESGSAYAIGMMAVQCLTRAVDGRAGPTLLMERVMRQWNLTNPRELYRKIYLENTTPVDFVDLIDVVMEAAESGDGTAREILHKTAVDLANLIVALAARLNLPGRFPCALSGSLLSENFSIRRKFLAETHKKGVLLDPVIEVKEPALGAIRLAISTL